ncbi:hypothetical protein TSAR_016483 [Trichomalopsis sarcophagae]|uniref:DNA-directed RNA polymerase III subunit RPC4 n=1 Tax=Trichomalopsis sarcophagae TaxID=543379 RepID=A0A232ES48_9HYME|nr:hypothetical protein TSAR_016483 [Trichomalopsis sarcophagae]
MSSNHSNVHPDYDPNLKIKAEPDPVSEPLASTAPSIPNLIQTIKTEPGLPAAPKPTIRLASIIPPRDLRLGGAIKLEKPKKVYTPNLNAQRFKNREDQNAANKSDPNPKTKARGQGDRGKNDRGRERGRGRGKAASNIIQTTGIFSEGLADLSTKRYSGGASFRDRESSGGGGGRETCATLERPKLSIPQKINKVEEAEKLRELLRDDFLDDGLDEDSENTPVALPMINEAKSFKTESNQKLDVLKGNDKSVNLQNGEAKASHQVKPAAPHVKTREAKVSLTVPQVMENKPSTFILVQLPDCLPGLESDDDPRTKKVAEPTTENETDKSNKFCTLNNLKEGMLGKLQILRSGKAQLVLGENNLIVDVGSNLSFRQDLIAAKINQDKQSGDLINLGPVNSTLICSPDWENMLKKLL